MQVDIWTIIVSLLMPIMGVALGLLWRQMGKIEERDDHGRDELWNQTNALRTELAAFMLDSNRRFVTAEQLGKLEERLIEELREIKKTLREGFVQRGGGA